MNPAKPNRGQQRLIKIMRQRKIDESTVAETIGVNRATINRYLSGNRIPQTFALRNKLFASYGIEITAWDDPPRDCARRAA